MCLGTYQYGPGDRHEITLSCVNVGHTDTLLRAMAHEMCHLRQLLRKTEGRGQHNAEFRRLGARVCRYHGWDGRLF